MNFLSYELLYYLFLAFIIISLILGMINRWLITKDIEKAKELNTPQLIAVVLALIFLVLRFWIYKK